MSGRAGWSYVQARLQARLGERLDEGDWQVLEGTKSLDHFLDRARATSLARFTERLDPQMSSHVIEQTLRAEWRRYVAEVADWPSPVWRPAVLWVEHVADLTLIDGLSLSRATVPDWVREDPRLRQLVNDEPPDNLHEFAGLLRASQPSATADTLPQRWLAHWRTLWPRRNSADCEWLDRFCALIAANFTRLAQAGPQDSSRPYRTDLARAFTRLVRRRAGTPVALFAHLGLVALDLERLRGGIVRRRWFAGADVRRAA